MFVVLNVHRAMYLIQNFKWMECFMNISVGIMIQGLFLAGTTVVSLYRMSRWALRFTKFRIQWLSQVKQLGYEADPWPPSSAEFKKTWSYTYTHTICLRRVYRDNFTFTILCWLLLDLLLQNCFEYAVKPSFNVSLWSKGCEHVNWKIWRGGDLTLMVLTWDHWIWTCTEGEP